MIPNLNPRACALGLLVFTATLVNEGMAHCRAVTAQLDYQAAIGCPCADDFAAIVARRLGHDPFRHDAGETVVVRLEPSGRTLVGRLEWRSAAGDWLGDRLFASRSGDCRELVRVLGFTLALQLQLMAADAASATPPSELPQDELPTTPVPDRSSEATAPPPVPLERATAIRHDGDPSRPSLIVGGGASVGLGLAPNAIALAHVFAALAWSRVAIELGAGLSVPSSMHRFDGEGFSEQLLFGSLAVCAVASPLSACVLTRLGEIRVAGEGVNQPLVASGTLAQTGVRRSLTQSLGRRAQVVAHAGSVAQLTRGVVTLDSTPIWTAPRVATELGIDIGIRFP